MKQVFVSYVMICSLLLAICGCSNDAILQQEPDLEFPKKPGIDQEETGNNDPDSPDEQEPNEPDLPDIDQEETGNNNPDSPDEQEPNKPDLPEVEPPEYNNRIPEIEINELRTEYSNSTSRAEFIEFKVKSAGNLDGLQLYIMWDAKEPYIFNLPAVDVKSSEYVVFHLRTLESTCVNELGEDLSESAGTDSSPTARDLWVPGSSKWLHKTDIVYLQDANGGILDAVILNEEPGETWDKNRQHFKQIVEDLYNKGAWKSADDKLPGPLDAVDTSTVKSAATKSISRYEGKENTRTANDWYITDTGGATPGQPNK